MLPDVIIIKCDDPKPKPKPKPKPTFTRPDHFKVYAEDPPTYINHGVCWASRIGQVQAANRPGVWFVIGECDSAGALRNTRYKLGRQYPDVEFRGTRLNGFKVYARIPTR